MQATQEWHWGELVAGSTYRGEIELSNRCATGIRVGLVADDLPDLLIQSTATIPGGRTIGVPYRITPTARPESEGAIRGRLVVWFRSPSDEVCPSFRLVHDVSARVRAATPADETIEKATATLAGACVQWWRTQVKPADRSDGECAPLIRRLIAGSRHVFERDRPDARTALSALPSADAMANMSMAQLSALRREFAAALGGGR